MNGPHDLPAEARALVTAIENHLRDAQALLQTGAQEADAFALREMQRRYLPETLQTYLAVPASLRNENDTGGESARSRLLATLRTLENAAHAHLEQLAAAQRDAVAVNQRFLTERFAGISPRTDSPLPTEAADAPVVRVFFQQARLDAAGDAQTALKILASRFEQYVPTLTRVERTFFTKAVKRIAIMIAIPNGALQYTLTATKTGFEAAVARIIRGIALKTEVLTTESWIDAVSDHMSEFAEQNQDAITQLHTLLGHDQV